MDERELTTAAGAVFLAAVAVFCAVQAVLSFTSWTSLGVTVLAILAFFLLWWIFQDREPTALQIARRLTSKLEDEAARKTWWRRG